MASPDLTTLPALTVIGNPSVIPEAGSAITYAQLANGLRLFGNLVQLDKGTVSGGTVTFDVSAAVQQKLTVGTALTVAYTNWPTGLVYGEIELELVNGGIGVTWPTINWLIGDGTSTTTFPITLLNPGTNWIIVWSTNAGVTLWGRAA